MSGYLLDTNIISEYNRAESPNPGVVQWITTTPEPLQYLSVLTLGEIEKGILLLDEGKRRREIQAPLLKQGRPLPTIDSLLAATALAHDLTFVTRNVRHFTGLNVPLFNPWELP